MKKNKTMQLFCIFHDISEDIREKKAVEKKLVRKCHFLMIFKRFFLFWKKNQLYRNVLETAENKCFLGIFYF